MAGDSGSGWMPPGNGVVHYPTTKIYAANTGHFALKAVVMHVAAGGYIGSRDWLCNAAINPHSSSHFIIDMQSGEIAQLASIFDRTWANGLAWNRALRVWIDPEGHQVAPPWPLLVDGEDPNLVTISVEHSGQPGDEWTEAGANANTRVTRFIARQTGIIYVPLVSLIGHCHISPKARPNCPGPHVDYAELARLGNLADVDGAPAPRLAVYSVERGPALERAGPSRLSAILGEAAVGRERRVRSMVKGQEYSAYGITTDQWALLEDGRYIWSGLLRRAG